MKMDIWILVMFFLMQVIMAHSNHPRIHTNNNYSFPFVTRKAWGAKPPTSPLVKLRTPVPYVVIHHTEIPDICLTEEKCMRDMRAIQNYHQDIKGWKDFAYNYAVGGEGSVYEGRGWEAVGSHAAGYNSKSIGIVLIGNFAYNFRVYPFPFISRENWGARPPTTTPTRLNTPVPYVVIHHTYIPGICLTRDQCMRDMQAMQNYHQTTNGWFDIGYNFAVGGEGSVFEGRGWEAVGAHAAGINSQSIGIAIIGDYRSALPPAIAFATTKLLIAEGVRLGHIRADYQLKGHREVSATECPGEALFKVIQTWDRYSGSTNESTGTGDDGRFSFITRAAWGANPPRSVTRLNTPVSHVVIHHSVAPGVCLTRDQCAQAMRSMQNSHQNANGWEDIGYNFAVGGEGSAYEGRGWETLGSHSAGFNTQSIGIVIIGNFVSQLPPAAALNTAKLLIADGVRQGYIRSDYRLLGHRQVRATECPGQTLFREIQTWQQFSWTV